MYEEKALRVIKADVAGRESLPALGKDLARRNIPLSLLYLSNTIAFLFSKGRHGWPMGSTNKFFANLGALPVFDETLVLHTETLRSCAHIPGEAENDRYLGSIFHSWAYIVQSMRDFQTFFRYADSSSDPRLFIENHIWKLRSRDGSAAINPKRGIYLLDVDHEKMEQIRQ